MPQKLNYSDTTPAAPAGRRNLLWTADAPSSDPAVIRNISVSAAAPYLLTGAGAPAVGLGVDGDYYMNTTNGRFYQRAAGAWASLNLSAAGKGALIAGTNVTLTDNGDGTTTVNSSGGGGGSAVLPSSVAGLETWIDASQLSGFADGAAVSTLPNLATSNLTGRKWYAIGTPPVYKAAILNGKGILRFIGTGWYEGFCPADDRGYSIFMVFKLSSLANAYTSILGTGWTSDAGGYLVKSTGKTAFYATGSIYDGTGAATLVTGSFYIATIVANRSATSTYTSRIALAADGPTSTTDVLWQARQFIIGGHPISGRALSGDFAELLFYNNAVSDTDRNAIENYLKTKYAL